MRNTKGMLLALAAMAMVGNTTAGSTHTHGYRSPIPLRNYKRENKPFLFPDPKNMPKGHKGRYITFEYQIQGHLVRAEVLVSGGTDKSLKKNIVTMGGEIHDYIVETGIQDLIKFNQFEIVELPKEETKVEELPRLKGMKNGNCNRTACQKPGAVYYNHSTEKYYCAECATMINDMNRTDAIRLYGHDLCTLDTEK